MSACIYFHPDGYTTKGRQIMGRHVAGESFLHGYLKYGSFSDLWVQIEDSKHAKIFESVVRECGRSEPINFIQRRNLALLKKPGCSFIPGPGLGEWAQYRSFHGNNEWSLCGITHTTASQGAMDSISNLLLAPVQPWDAVICTSHAVKNNVSRILEAEIDYLKHRFHGKKFLLPKLPVIPLGVHTQNFSSTPLLKAKARKKLGIPDDALVVLFVGRLTFHGKAHPLVMYKAVEEAAKQTKKKVILLECGWHYNDYIKKAFEQAASFVFKKVTPLIIDGRDAKHLSLSWQVADIFCSLSDNIQETFGITPIEAMASGLPVVVSDWDGYRDTVRHGIDGFRISTVAPPPGFGIDLAERHALGIDTYDMYCGYTSSMVSVDARQATNAFIQLFTSSELRIRMGEAGKLRARNTFDWEIIIPIYEKLWSELKAIKNHVCEPRSKFMQPWSARLDPFYTFISYPTANLLPETRLALCSGNCTDSMRLFQSLKELNMVNYIDDIMASDEEIHAIFEALAKGPIITNELISAVTNDPLSQKRIFYTLAWLLKLAIIELVNPPTLDKTSS